MLGLVMAAASVLYGIIAISVKLAGLSIVPGYTSLLVAITFLSGVQLTVLGMVGQYVARIYDEARARPLYLVRDARGFAAGTRHDDDSVWPSVSPDSVTSGQRIRSQPS